MVFELYHMDCNSLHYLQCSAYSKYESAMRTAKSKAMKKKVNGRDSVSMGGETSRF